MMNKNCIPSISQIYVTSTVYTSKIELLEGPNYLKPETCLGLDHQKFATVEDQCPPHLIQQTDQFALGSAD